VWEVGLRLSRGQCMGSGNSEVTQKSVIIFLFLLIPSSACAWWMVCGVCSLFFAPQISAFLKATLLTTHSAQSSSFLSSFYPQLCLSFPPLVCHFLLSCLPFSAMFSTFSVSLSLSLFLFFLLIHAYVNRRFPRSCNKCFVYLSN